VFAKADCVAPSGKGLYRRCRGSRAVLVNSASIPHGLKGPSRGARVFLALPGRRFPGSQRPAAGGAACRDL